MKRCTSKWLKMSDIHKKKKATSEIQPQQEVVREPEATEEDREVKLVAEQECSSKISMSLGKTSQDYPHQSLPAFFARETTQ